MTETAQERLVHRRRRQPRKSSILRPTDRRVSDAMLNFMAADEVSRLSSRELSKNEGIPDSAHILYRMNEAVSPKSGNTIKAQCII